MQRQPWELTFDEFIGPYMVSEIFAFDGRDDDWDWIWEDEEGIISGLSSPLWTSPCGQYDIRQMEGDSSGAQLFAIHNNSSIVGIHFNGMNWVAEEHRGRGLAVEITILAAHMLGGSPIPNQDGLGFCEAGVGVMQKAHRTIVERAVMSGEPVPEHVLSEYGMTPQGLRA